MTKTKKNVFDVQSGFTQYGKLPVLRFSTTSTQSVSEQELNSAFAPKAKPIIRLSRFHARFHSVNAQTRLVAEEANFQLATWRLRKAKGLKRINRRKIFFAKYFNFHGDNNPIQGFGKCIEQIKNCVCQSFLFGAKHFQHSASITLLKKKNRNLGVVL